MLAVKRVLCVDDHMDTCALVGTILQSGHVISAHTKADGLRQAATDRFDLILIDYHLPDGTGFELSELIRAFDVSTPILFITATHSITHEEAVAVGGQGVVRKDHFMQVLPAAVAHAFEVKLLRRWH